VGAVFCRYLRRWHLRLGMERRRSDDLPGTAGQGVTGLLYGDVTQFFLQIGGATLIALYAFVFTYVVFKVVNRIVPLRVPRGGARRPRRP